MGNPNLNPTRYKIEQMHWRSALNKCIEQMYWLINIHQYIFSHLSEKEKKTNLSLLSEREREKIYFVKT
jgi:hypothetical protein